MAGYVPARRAGGLLGVIESRRSEVARANAFTVMPQTIAGFHEFTVPNNSFQHEIIVDLIFPVWFTVRPGISGIIELGRELLVAGRFLRYDIVVSGWEKVYEQRVGGGYFSGVQLAVVLTKAQPNERMTLHWQATGPALNIPPTAT